ncbi:MAG TPA: putative glycoside hydrolase [Gemmatimonadales bacterium]|nr:putative glycoside hydrolase [Gemmatimonadales bacterium]
MPVQLRSPRGTRGGALVALLALGLAAPLAAQQRPAPSRAGGWGDELPGFVAAPERLRPVAPRQSEPIEWPPPPISPPPKVVKAIYLNAWTFASRRFYELVRLADTTEVNAFVIDVKDDTGYLTYPSKVPTAVEIGANHQIRARDTRERLAILHQHGIYPIARIVVAKDPLLARNKPAWSVKDSRGGLWQDRLHFNWVDAYNDSVWVYAAQLGAEAIQHGFSELQFDYVRFPDEPRARMATAVFSARRNNESPRHAVARHLAMLRDRIHALGVPFTIDIFGMTASAEQDLGIGQVWEDLVRAADVVLPMVYPSHYYGGFYNIRHPNSEPYQVVHLALQDAERRTAAVPNAARIRPYLQAFTLGKPRYTPVEVRDQIRAAADLGINSWVLWNPRGVYDPRIFLPRQSGTLASAQRVGG